MRALNRFPKLKNRTVLLAASMLLSAFLLSCSGSSTQSGMSCSITASIPTTSSTDLTLAITCGGGTAPYTVSNILVNGVTPISVSGTLAGFATSTTVTVIDSVAITNGLTGTLSVVDSSGAAAQTLTYTVGGSVSTGCTITASNPYPAVGSEVTFTFTQSGTWGTAPYTFSAFTPGSGGTIYENIVPTATTQAIAAAYYASVGTTTASVNITDMTGITQTCSTSIDVGGTPTIPTCTTGICNLTCTLGTQVQSNGLVAFEVTDTYGDALTIINFSGGAGSTVYQSGNPTYVGYTSGGQKYISAQAYNPSTGASCNGGAPLTGYINVTTEYSGSGGGGYYYNTGSAPTCTAYVSTSTPTIGVPFTAGVYTSGGSGSVSLIHIQYPTGAELSGTFTSATSANLTFGTTGTFGLTFIVEDQAGNTGVCGATETVY